MVVLFLSSILLGQLISQILPQRQHLRTAYLRGTKHTEVVKAMGEQVKAQKRSLKIPFSENTWMLVAVVLLSPSLSGASWTLMEETTCFATAKHIQPSFPLTAQPVHWVLINANPGIMRSVLQTRPTVKPVLMLSAIARSTKSWSPSLDVCGNVQSARTETVSKSEST
jgi:hypothetical protein